MATINLYFRVQFNPPEVLTWIGGFVRRNNDAHKSRNLEKLVRMQREKKSSDEDKDICTRMQNYVRREHHRKTFEKKQKQTVIGKLSTSFVSRLGTFFTSFKRQ